MKLVLTPALLVLTLLAAGLAGMRQDDGGAAPAAAAADSKEALLEHMKAIETDLKALRRGLRKPEDNPDSLARIAAMQQHALACKSMAIPMTERQPEDARPAFQAAYRKAMAELVVEMLNLEIALLDGDNDRAQEIYKVLKELEAGGHERFMPEE